MKKKLFLFIISISLFAAINAQMDLPPSGGDPRARITEEGVIIKTTIFKKI